MTEIIDYKGQAYPIRYQHHRALNKVGTPQPKGGKTIAYIKLSDTERIVAEAKCNSKLQAFSKRLGRDVSKGRLIKQLESANVTIEDIKHDI